MSFNQDEQANANNSGSADYDMNLPVKDNIDSDIEKNLVIKTMPRKFKVSTPSPKNTKNKAVGVVIMVVGIVIMGVAVYLVYAFLINPKNQANTPANTPASQQKKEAVVEQKKNNQDSTKKNEPSSTVNKNEQAASDNSASTDTNSSNNTIKDDSMTQKSSTTIVTENATTQPATSTSKESSSQTTPVVAQKAVDTDKDGLSDKEEVLLGLNSTVTDSDGDGFSDMAELGNMYNPAGAGKLSDNVNLVAYKNATYKYSILRPKSWREQQVGDSIIFSSPDNSFVQIIAEPNDGNKDILAWYNGQFLDSPASLSDVVVKNGWNGLYHKDGQIFYLTDSDKKKTVFTISYTPSEEGGDDYYNIFKLIVSSFTF